MNQSGNQVEAYLRVLLTELYSFIVEEAQKSPAQLVPNLYKQIAEHEAYDSLVISVVRDRSLAKFFPALRGGGGHEPDVGSLKDLQTIVIWSDASSEGMTPLTLCSSIISDVFRYLWSWTDQPSLNDALVRLPDSIDLARNLAEKRTVEIPAVVSIHNIDLMDNDTVEVGSAVLRKPLRYDRSRLHTIVSGQELSAVLRLQTDFSAIHVRATSRESDREEEQQKTQHLIETLGYPSMEKQTWKFQGVVDRARLAIVLSSRPGEIFAPVQGWDSVVNPLSDIYHSQLSGARSFNAPYPIQSIDEAAKRRIASLAPLIEGHPNALRTGIRRLLLAVTERMYSEDGFVDAIIAWENLFSGFPETSLRVCGAMARLLSPVDIERKLEVYRELTSLYRKRNSVVHGSSTGSSTATAQDRDLAVDYTLKAFEAIYQREDLLRIETSPERGISVLLGP